MNFKFFELLVVIATLGSSIAYAAPTTPSGESLPNRKEAAFIENKGQWTDQVLYLTPQPNLNAWITTDGIVYDFYRFKPSSQRPTGCLDLPPPPEKYGHVIALQVVNAENKPVSKGVDPLATYYNYFLGNDSSRWTSRVPLYQEVWVQNILDGISMRHYYDQDGLRFDFIVDPHGSPESIALNIEGTDEWQISEGNQLTLTTRFGEVTLGDLYAYQEVNGQPQEVRCHFVRRQDGYIGFKVGSYDSTRPLIIDPLMYSTFLGGNNNDFSWDLEVDTIQHAYVVGFSASTNFPTTTGTYDPTHNGNYDVTISKINTSGSNLVFSTFLGGNNLEYGLVIDVDSAFDIYIGGETRSTNFPTTAGAYDATYNGGGMDIFVSKLKHDGTALLFSTYIGGSNYEEIFTIKVDSANYVYIGGYTSSSNYPTTTNAYDVSFNGVHDAVLTKFSPSGQSLVFSTFLGGNDTDHIHSVRILPSGNYFISGHTASSDFPTTSGAFDTSYNGNHDVFLAKMDNSASTLLLSSYIGGSGREESYYIRSDSNENLYISGFTTSSDFPTTLHAYDTSYNGGQDGFIIKMDTNDNLLYSTYLGGSGNDIINGIYTTPSGYVYFVGETTSSDFPTTTGSYDSTFNGGQDVCFGKLSPAGITLVYSSYIGGQSTDRGISIDVDIHDYVYIAGYTASSNYPTTTGAYDVTFNGGTYDGFVTKFGTPALPVEWIDFTITLVNTGVAMDWWTATEVNSYRFVIERSQDGKSWEDIGMVRAAGESQQMQAYHYLDHMPPQGLLYYRIRQEDYDGSYSYSPVRKVVWDVQETTRPWVWAIYRRNGGLDLESQANHPMQEIIVRDVMGRRVRHLPNLHTTRLSLFTNDLPKGTYFIEVHGEGTAHMVIPIVL